MLKFMPEPVVETTLDILGEPNPAEQRISPDVEQVLGRPPGPSPSGRHGTSGPSGDPPRLSALSALSPLGSALLQARAVRGPPLSSSYGLRCSVTGIEPGQLLCRQRASQLGLAASYAHSRLMVCEPLTRS